MTRKYFLPVLAVVGLTIAIGVVIQGNQKAPAAPPIVLPAKVAFQSYIAASGIIEARSQNIAIGTPVSGIVTAINVKWDDWVNMGDVLFKIDDRDLQGQLLPAVAKLKEAEATLAKLKNSLRIVEILGVGPISELELSNRRFDAAKAEAELGSAQAFVAQLKIEVERRMVRAPLPSRVLQIGIRLVEFAQSGSTPLMLLGDDTRLHARVNIDENDAWRLQPSAPALLVVRSNPDLKTPLRFERIEPYVIPKMSLTGQGTERPDVRVLQVIYSFDRGALPVYIGQQVDAYIETPPNGAPSTISTAPPEAK